MVARVAPVAEDHLILVVAEVAYDASHGAHLVVLGTLAVAHQVIVGCLRRSSSRDAASPRRARRFVAGAGPPALSAVARRRCRGGPASVVVAAAARRRGRAPGARPRPPGHVRELGPEAVDVPAPRAVVAQHEVRLVVAEPAPLALGIIVVVVIVVGRGDGLLRRATRATHRPGATENARGVCPNRRVIGICRWNLRSVRGFRSFLRSSFGQVVMMTSADYY